MKPTSSETLKTDLQGALADLTQAESRFKDAVATADSAKVLTNATQWLAATREVEAARRQLLESASAVEAALEKFNAAADAAYRDGMQAATTRSRGLHAKRLELEAQLAELNADIILADVDEKPDVDKVL